MRKSTVVIPLLALIAGGIGFLVRLAEVNTGFEATTGFAKRDSLMSTLLIILVVAVLVLSAVAGVMTASRRKADNDYGRAFAPKGFIYLATSFVLAFAWLVADVLYFFDYYGRYMETAVDIGLTAGFPVLETIFVFLAAVSAISLIFLARGAYRGRAGGEMLLFSIIPSVFFCFWLILVYKNNASNPVILSFCYQCLAIAAAALSYYFSAGYVYKKSAVGRTVFSFLATIFFCILVLADTIILPVKIIYGLTAVWAFMNCFVFLRNLKGKYEVS
jgi:hypothetical protein